jgi:hypothetical protein
MNMRTSAPGSRDWYQGKRRFEHWYRDNTVYFITARCRDRHLAFKSPEARIVFWDRFDHYTAMHGFDPWITTLLGNHYHTLGYLRFGRDLGEMMRKIHGSVAKLVNDLLPVRLVPFWWDRRDADYFDGCLRDALQYRRAYRYTLLQAVCAGIVPDWRLYPDTRVNVELEEGLRRALELKAFLTGVPYKRYQRRGRTPPSSPGVRINWDLPDDLDLSL